MHMELTLTEEEQHELKQMHRREKDGKKRDRIKAILLFSKGYTASQIAEILLVDSNTVTEWKERYEARTEKNSTEWLRMQILGYQGKLSKDEQTQVETYVQANLVVDAKQVIRFIHETFGESYTISGVTEVLHRLGFAYKKTTLVPAKMDIEKQAEFKRLYDEFVSNIKEDEAVLFLDAVHPQHNTKCAYAWIKIGEEKQIKSNSGRKRLNISGAYNPYTQDILAREDKTVNADTVIAFFKQIEEAYPNKATIYAIADQAPYYQNKDVKKYLETSRIEVMSLPAYSPNLNLIERLWKLLRKKAINTTYYEKFADFKEAVLGFLSGNSETFKAELRQFIGTELHLLNAV